MQNTKSVMKKSCIHRLINGERFTACVIFDKFQNIDFVDLAPFRLLICIQIL